MSTRRDFLKTTALVGASVPLVGADLSLLSTSKKVTTATHWQISEVTVKNGIIVDTDPLKKDSKPSMMAQTLKSRVYGQTRVQYPYVREGFLKNRHKSDTSKRGQEKFIRVSWDEVNQILFEELNRVKKTYGDRALYAGSYGWQCAGKVNGIRTLLKRMLNVTGNQFVDSIGNYSTGALTPISTHILGINQYHRHTSLDLIAKKTDNLIMLGCDLLKTNQIEWGAPAHKAYDGFEKIKMAAKKRKMNIVSIDPYITDTSKYLGATNLRIKPNTDVALLLAVAHYLYTNNLHNKKFLKKYTVGFDSFKDYLMGKTDKVEKTPKWASKITEISEKEIIALAKMMSKGKTMIMPGWSMQRADHGEQPCWMIYTLASMLGQIGTDGAGFGSSYNYASTGANLNNGVGLSGMTAGKSISTTKDAIPVARISDMLLNPGKTIDFNGRKITYADIKMVWWAGGNPMHHHQDRNTMVQAWRKPEVIVNQDPFWTASSRMADIVLPATIEIERNDITNVGSNSHTGLLAMKQAIDPVGESKNDFDISKDIAALFGKEKEFTEGKDQMGWAKVFYDKARAQAKAKKIDMPTFEKFWEDGAVYFDKKSEFYDNYNAFQDFIEDPLDSPLGTPSGKIEIASKKIASFKYDDCYGHAAWFEPAEYLGNSTKAYPFHLLSPHPSFRLHSQLNNTILREVYQVGNREPILINPKNAKAKGIKDGDIVLVSSPRGKVLAGAIVTPDIRENVLMMHEGGWFDPKDLNDEKGMCVHGDVNMLTLDKGASKLSQANVANTALVTIEKYTGKVPPVKVFSKPNLG